MNHKFKAVLIGVAAGALLGAAFAWVVGEGESSDEIVHKGPLSELGPMDYFALGISILTLARQFGGMVRRA